MRPEPLEVRLIDALEQAINSSPNLPDHQTVLYKRARAVLPSDCPLLTIFLLQKLFTAETVTYFDDAIAIGITWQEEAVQQASTLIDEPEESKSQLRSVKAIEDVIFGLALTGLEVERAEMEDGSGREADNAYAIYPVSIDLAAPVEVEEGLVEGYAMTIEVDATQTKMGG